MTFTITYDRKGHPDGGVRTAKPGDHPDYATEAEALKWSKLLAEDYADRKRRGCRGSELLF